LRAELSSGGGGSNSGGSEIQAAKKSSLDERSLLPGITLRQTQAALVADLEGEVEVLRASDTKWRDRVALLEQLLRSNTVQASEAQSMLEQVVRM
jgi:hypothetical protein